LREQQAGLFDVAEQLVFGEDSVKQIGGEPVLAALEEEHVPILPDPAGPSSSNGFCILAARYTTLIITGSMK
jgi:hypothetical protein